MGNKQRIADDIIPIMLNNYNGNTFVDAFCGSCSVIENVPNTYRRIANDKQKYLIAMWKSLTNGKEFPKHIDKTFYDKVRDCSYGRNNDYEEDLVGWVGFMASFNGRFFDGGYSGHNVLLKSGKPRDYITENINNTLKQVDKLKNVEWYSGDYYNCPLPENSLIYCDPPYQGTKQYANAMTFDYEEFWQYMRDWSKNNIVLISEQNAPDDFECIWEQEVSRSIKAADKSKSTEKLFKWRG